MQVVDTLAPDKISATDFPRGIHQRGALARCCPFRSRTPARERRR
jgi:hypothetical protein